MPIAERVYSCALWVMQYFEAYLFREFIVEMRYQYLEKVQSVTNPSMRLAMWQVSF